MMLLEELEAFKGGGGGGGGRSSSGSSRRKNRSKSGLSGGLSGRINYFALFAFLVVLFFLPAIFLSTKKK
jgi:hypothetical protein